MRNGKKDQRDTQFTAVRGTIPDLSWISRSGEGETVVSPDVDGRFVLDSGARPPGRVWR